jgi:uncharacterized protein (DUF2267 family)
VLQTALTAFEHTVQTTTQWLHDIEERMGWQDQHRAYLALRAVLHALRDRLTVEQAAALAAQLPMLVRGFYYEGWHPHGKPLKQRKREEFLTHVAEGLRDDPYMDSERVTEVVLDVLASHVSRGEIEGIKRSLPASLRELWP